MNYVTERMELDSRLIQGLNSENAQAEALKWSTNKFKHWEYEEEVRVFLSLKQRGDLGYYWCPFNEEISLREIILGPLCGLRRTDIKSALQVEDKAVELYKARLAFKKYRVVRQMRSDLW